MKVHAFVLVVDFSDRAAGEPKMNKQWMRLGFYYGEKLKVHPGFQLSDFSLLEQRIDRGFSFEQNI